MGRASVCLRGDGDAKAKSQAAQLYTSHILARRRNVWASITFFLSMLGTVTMVVEREMLHAVFKDRPNSFSSTLRFAVSANCLLLCITLCITSCHEVAYRKACGQLYQGATVCNTGSICCHLFLDCAISLIHVPPYVLETEFMSSRPGLSYWLVNILSWGMLLRLRMVPGALQRHFTMKYVGLKEQFLAKLSNVRYSAAFVIRAYLYMYPLVLITGALLLTVFTGTFLLDEAEQGMRCQDDPPVANS